MIDTRTAPYAALLLRVSLGLRLAFPGSGLDTCALVKFDGRDGRRSMLKVPAQRDAERALLRG